MLNGLSQDKAIALQEEFQSLVDSGRAIRSQKTDCYHFIPVMQVFDQIR